MPIKEKTLRELNDEWLKAKGLKSSQDDSLTDIQAIGAVLGLFCLAVLTIGALAYGIYRAFAG